MSHGILQQGRFCSDGEMVLMCKASAAEVHKAFLLENS